MGIMVCLEGHYANTTSHHDFIEFYQKTPERIYEECASLYENGLSLSDISERTGIPKSTILDALKLTIFQLEAKQKP